MLACVVAGTHTSPGKSTSFDNAPDVPWQQPTELAVHNLGPRNPDANEYEYDCTILTYRRRFDLTKKMHSGCFTPTAFGLVDQASSMVIFNGTDEAEPLYIGGQPAAMSVLPYSGSLATFGGFPGNGSYMYLYKNVLSKLHTGGTFLGSSYPELDSLPDFTVPDPQGRPLPVNPTALAYSARGQWMVTESPTRSLVRVNLATYTVLPFAPSYYMPLNPFAGHSASMAITESGRYTAAASNEFNTFKVYDLKSCHSPNATDPLLPQSCESFNYWPYIRSQVTGTLQSISQVKFIDDTVIGFTARTSTGTEHYLLSPNGLIRSLIPYLGTGDSYASGQGAFNYLTGTDTASNKCHLSAKSYPHLLSADVFGGRGRSVACSGARIHDIGDSTSGYTGQSSEQKSAAEREADGSEIPILHDFSSGFIAQHRFVGQYRPKVLTVQIGGNDIGFGNVLLRCLKPGGCYNSYEDRLEIAQTIDRTYKRWVQLYSQLQTESPETLVYAIGYPQIFSTNAQCGLNAPVTLYDISFARDVTNYLNSVIEKAARAAGANYIDISDALKGSELCSGAAAVAINGLTAGNDTYVLGQESFHPNALGHQMIEQTILQKTKNFAVARQKPLPAQPAPEALPTEPLLNAPKTGRNVAVTAPSPDLIKGDPVRGGVVNVEVSSTAGLKPNTTYQIILETTGSIGSIVTNIGGSGTATVVIPGNATPGPKQVSVEGNNQNNQPIKITDVIYVRDKPSDQIPTNSLNAPSTTDEPKVTPIIAPSGNFENDTQSRRKLSSTSSGRLVVGSSLPSKKLVIHPPRQSVLSAESHKNISTNQGLRFSQLAIFRWYFWLLAVLVCSGIAGYAWQKDRAK
jgi:lysophospholipase L1-like esterase